MPLASLHVDRSSPLRPAEQLKARLRAAVQWGELRPGARLPRVRQLAAELGLNPNTVGAVYRDLAREGFLTPRGKGGTRVAPGPFLQRKGDGELLALADRLVATAQRLGRAPGDILRLVAGRWNAPLAPRDQLPETGRSVYALLATTDHDDG